ncbi:hypothetical protein NC99_04350 [Sunxiuqinia dokdonensis]|uniref:Uncharacterized protein n=1 Tax=Sunxiuqinia dokdonensis TaxID=1409788 RepID=A0A0L8VE39_9BACT|nr:hypothetical protein NC99_04350 [Sunxiuqinia dokdonensis]
MTLHLLGPVKPTDSFGQSEIRSKVHLLLFGFNINYRKNTAGIAQFVCNRG